MNAISKRLFVVTLPFTAQHASGGERLLRAGEELSAGYPVREDDGIVVFEQDNQEFGVAATTFLSSTRLKNPVEEALDRPSFGGSGAPPKCKAEGCGHQKLEHENGRGACRAMIVVGNRQIQCLCRKFEP